VKIVYVEGTSLEQAEVVYKVNKIENFHVINKEAIGWINHFRDIH
jgi:hypothetical protein